MERIEVRNRRRRRKMKIVLHNFIAQAIVTGSMLGILLVLAKYVETYNVGYLFLGEVFMFVIALYLLVNCDSLE